MQFYNMYNIESKTYKQTSSTLVISILHITHSTQLDSKGDSFLIDKEKQLP